MSIIRAARKERDFAILSNALLQDNRLSMRSLGLLVRLLSRPDNWETNSEVLAREFNCGREQMRSVLNELSDAGYMRLVKTQDTKGHWSSRWYVFDDPESEEPKPRLPEPGNRVLGDPDAITKNRYKEPIQRTDIGITEKKQKVAKPSVEKPDGVDEQTWADWIKHRKEKKAPVTETAMKGIAREAEKAGISLDRALTEACANGWQGFRAAWFNKSNGAQPSMTGAGRNPPKPPIKSFEQQRREDAWAAWEKMSGETHPERINAMAAEHNTRNVIDITPRDITPPRDQLAFED